MLIGQHIVNVQHSMAEAGFFAFDMSYGESIRTTLDWRSPEGYPDVSGTKLQ